VRANFEFHEVSEPFNFFHLEKVSIRTIPMIPSRHFKEKCVKLEKCSLKNKRINNPRRISAQLRVAKKPRSIGIGLKS